MAVAISGMVPTIGHPAWARRVAHSRLLQLASLTMLVAGLSAGSYYVFLGWGRRRVTGVDAYLSTGSRGWQIALLIAFLSLIALGVGWLGHPIVGSVALTASVTTLWALDAALNVRGDRNWPIGMTLVAWASFGGALALSGAVTEARRLRRQRAEEIREAAQARVRAEAQRLEAIRSAAEMAASRERAAAELERQQRAAAAARAAAEAARAAAAASRVDAQVARDRRAKVVQVLRSSATRMRSSSSKGRAKAS